MSDIDPSKEPNERSEPLRRMPRAEHPEQRTSPVPRKLVSGCIVLPGVLLSATFIVISISYWGSDSERTIVFSLLQIAGLLLAWRYLSKATSWGVVALGIIITVGFYLLMLGFCTA